MTQDAHALMVFMVNGVILFTVAEGAALTLWHQRTGRGPGAGAIVVNLLAGLFLLLALRSVLAEQGWAVCALWLAAAGAAHAADLWRRWPSSLSSHQGTP
ncbi:MAG: hypothetical protein U1F53_04115 [Burkholderiaceae bacterium]